MKVLLTTPPYDKNRFRLGESLGLKYLAAFLLQRGIDTYVLEPTLLDWDIEKTADFIINKDVDFLGISVQFSRGLSNAVKVMERVKGVINPHISIGGHFATFHCDELLESISALDSIVMFEGELTLVELLERLNQPEHWHKIDGLAFRDNSGKIHKTPPRPLIQNLDTLPFPIRDETSRMAGDPHYSVISSRGCLLCCTFCSVPSFYNEPSGSRWRARSPENVVDELEILAKEFAATEISFLDDNFIGSNNAGRKRAKLIAKEIIKRKLNLKWAIECRADDVKGDLLRELMDAGLTHINLGIESGSQDVLSGFKKLTSIEDNRRAIETVRSLGLGAYYHFIMFSANTTLDEIESSLAFIQACGIASFTVISNRLDVYKGTAEYHRLNSGNRLIKKGYEYTFNFLDPKVELVYQAIHRGMNSLYNVELALQKASFHDDVRIPDGENVPRNHFEWSSSQNKQKLLQLELRLSDKTSQLVKQIIDFVRGNESITKSAFSSFVDEIENNARSFSDEMLRELLLTYNEV